MASKDALLSIIEKSIDQQQFRSLHWEGSFDDYLELVARIRPSRATRSSACTT